MPITQSVNSKANVKRPTTNDLPFSAQQPVINSYYATSTAGQTIINFGFTIQTTGLFANTDVFWLFIDGKKLDLGSGNDYTFTNVGSDGTSSQITLNQTLPVGLNIQAFKLGLKPEVQFGMDNRFVQLYSALGSGFQGFVDQSAQLTATSSSGTPAAGTFYSTISNRASMVDLSQDLKPRMGIERIPVQVIELMQGEFGPNQEAVWGVANDTFGQIRFIGQWLNLADSNGTRPYLPSASSQSTDALEVTFYGTGLNVLALWTGTTQTYSVSVDGGTATALPTTSYSTPLNGRNYDVNCVLNVAKGLALGIHTVRMTKNTATTDFNVYGFDILNESSNVVTTPGIAYNQGKSIASGSQSAIAYNSSVAGTTGGRVLHYLSSSGTVSQAFTQNATSPLYLTAANHSNEEVARVFAFREFGAARGDDFSVGTSFYARAFTLDDGTTNVLATNAAFGGTPEGVNPTNSSYMTITFVGTGLDIVQYEPSTGTADVITVSIDGTSVGTFDTVGIAGRTRTMKVASGLPYGTHVVRLAASASGFGMYYPRFLVYQPKKPTLPSGAVELGDYHVLPSYSLTSSATQDGTSAGVIAKSNVREVIYSGTWSVALNTSVSGGQTVATSTNGSSLQYTFFGTGLELIANAGTSASITVNVDGAAYTGSATALGGGTWTAGTSTWAVTSTNGGRLSISGLTLGAHTITFTVSANSGSFFAQSLAVITPIYSAKSNSTFSAQNTMTVGSNAISDNRKITPIKDAGLGPKAISQAVGIASSPTTTSTSLIPMQDMSVVHTNKTGRIKVTFTGNLSNSVSGGYTDAAIFIDGSQLGNSINGPTTAVAGQVGTVTNIQTFNVSPGTHKVDIYWVVGSGTGTANATQRILIVEEI